MPRALTRRNCGGEPQQQREAERVCEHERDEHEFGERDGGQEQRQRGA